MNPSRPELSPQRPVRSDFGRTPSYRTRRIITIVVAAGVLLGGARLILGNPFSHSGAIATIKAEGAWKQKPDQPGGIDIPNQDVRVYQALDNKDNTKTPVEHLLPPPETPLPAPQATNSAPATAPPTSPTSNVSSASPIESLVPPKLEIDEVVPPVISPPVPTPAPQAPASNLSDPALAPPPVSAPAAAIESSPIPANSPPAAVQPVMPTHVVKPKLSSMAQVLQDTKSIPKTDRIVQVASVQDQASAQAMAEKLQIRYAAILGSTRLHIVEAKVAGKGTYYRIQSPPVSGDHASGICAAIQKMKAGCILVRP